MVVAKPNSVRHNGGQQVKAALVKRIRPKDGVLFRPDTPGGPYRAEVIVASDSELKDLKRDRKLLRVRMSGTTAGGKNQYNLVPASEITDFTW